MELNIVQGFFLFLALSMLVFGSLINLVEPYLPVIITRSFRYGKFAAKGESIIVANVEVPKRWFKLFYTFAGPFSSCILLLIIAVYRGGYDPSRFILRILDLTFTNTRKPLVTAEHACLATVLVTIQCWKRFYETHYVSVFSEGKINISHYIIGFVHYIGVGLCLIGESRGFVEGYTYDINFNGLTKIDYACTLLFVWASYAQLSSNFILAGLRKNKKGEVVTLKHGLPEGGLFDYISSPLQLTEIIMYASLTIILRGSTSFPYIFAWVLTNQAETALLNHWWNVETFKKFPQQRKALIPGIL